MRSLSNSLYSCFCRFAKAEGASLPSKGKDKAATACLVLSVAVLSFSLLGSVASAASPSPGWTIDSFASPTNFSASDNAECLASGQTFPPCDSYEVTATNAGRKSTDGSPVTLSDTLPAGLTVQRISLFSSRFPGFDLASLAGCSATPVVNCELAGFISTVEEDVTVQMIVYVTVDDANASGPLINTASVSGGGAPEASASKENQIASTQPPFGLAGFSSYIAGPDGAPDTQAGDHPYELTTRIDLNNGFRFGPENPPFIATSIHDVKDVVVDLPLGFVGSALSAPTCTLAQLSAEQSCPIATRVGHIVTEPHADSAEVNGYIYNLVPEHGVAAEFGFVDALQGSHVLYARVVPTPAGYVLEVTSPDVAQVNLTDVRVTFFGNPAVKDKSGNPPAATFTNPSVCSGQPLLTTIHMDSWQSPGRFNADGTPDLTDPNWATAASESPPVAGCDKLQFKPSMTAQFDTTVADSPAGLDLELKLPQSEDPNTLATPPLRKGVVTLPQGFTVDPSSADGLQACSPAQIALASASEPTCPAGSKIGTVELTTPLLPNLLRGAIYLATQNENPFHSLLAGYIVVDDPTTGVVIKLPGKIDTDPQTGQITGTFDNNPQLPFTDLKLHFFGGPRGDLATPEGCGTYTTTSDFSPWSTPWSGPDATPTDSFQVNTGCVSGFAPAFDAGTMSPQAGTFSPFTLSFSRDDNEEGPAGLTVSLPTGLLGKIAGVTKCSDAQVAAAAAHSGATEQSSPGCPSSSLLGTVTTASGPGPTPFVVGGNAYLTGLYKGAPFGIAVVVPALAGPFDLGTVVIRQALFVDPNDAHATDVSDPFPTILQGIPLRIRRVNVTLDRPEFTFNPTSCDQKAINATVTSIGGAHAPVSSRFQAAGCQGLPFRPSFSMSTEGKTSKANGASLTVRVTQKPGEADIHKVNLQLPIALPSRLTTLQKACTEAQFNANPAGCPSGSVIGSASARTPVLNMPLTGPAYLVSHGGAAFPDVEFILQGEGVVIYLDGKTDIKKGITYSRFETVPDAPISSFETVLPEGPHSVLAASGNLCALTRTVTVTKHVTRRVHGRARHLTVKVKNHVAQSLQAPVTIAGQNGAQVTQNTKIAITGCSKAKAKKAAKPKNHKKAKGKKK